MASGFRLADPREYRRGVILGLTLAEVLILLVFLLLLSTGALLAKRGREIGDLRAKLGAYESQMASVLDRLRQRGIQIADADELVARLERAEESDRIRRELDRTKSALAQAQADAAKSAREASELRARLERIPADRQEAAAKLAQEQAMESLLGQAGAPGVSAPERLRGLIERTSRLETDNRNLTGQNAQMRNEITRVKGNGGSGLPYCWATAEGHPEYMLRIELHDRDIVVSDVSPRPRPDDPAWQLLDGLPRGQSISMSELLSAVAPLRGRAAAARCRYAVYAFDGTARTNKPGYKSMMGQLWTVFMVHEVYR